MILDAAETVLGYFGFVRTVYGSKKNTGTRMEVGTGPETRKGKRYQDRDMEGHFLTYIHAQKFGFP